MQNKWNPKYCNFSIDTRSSPRQTPEPTLGASFLAFLSYRMQALLAKAVSTRNSTWFKANLQTNLLHKIAFPESIATRSRTRGRQFLLFCFLLFIHVSFRFNHLLLTLVIVHVVEQNASSRLAITICQESCIGSLSSGGHMSLQKGSIYDNCQRHKFIMDAEIRKRLACCLFLMQLLQDLKKLMTVCIV